ncbi:MAG: hypothetical protein WC009_00620 [Methylotenera sp.]
MKNHYNKHNAQKGGALIIFVLVLVLAGSATLFSLLDGSDVKIERDKNTAVTLAEAKVALLGYMVSRTTATVRPGDLPCPDKSADHNYDGTQDSPCSSSRIGKFPWSNVDHLGVFNEGIVLDLVDANGDRFWYAVSRNLVDPTNVPVNSDLVITSPYPWLSVYDSRGNLMTNRAVAVIVASGNVLDGQDRSSALPSAAQYLDHVTLNAVTYNNAASSPAKFISGIVYDPLNPNKVVVNDQITYITIDEVMPLIEIRVAREAKKCLDDYAKINGGNYPWAAPVIDTVTYASTTGTRFGRLPSGTFATAGCNTAQAWWADWQNFVFYTFPISHQPGSPIGCVVAGDCLTVNGSGVNRALVLMGRKAMGAQNHAIPNIANNFLEGSNASLTTNYLTYKPSDVVNYSVVNDLVQCLDGQNNCK